MPKNLLKEEVNVGEVVFATEINEFEKYQRGKNWYLIMSILGIGLVLIAIFTANYLFALIIVLFAIIIVLQEMNEPALVDFGITKTGIIVGSKYYSFSEIERFWIIDHSPSFRNLYFEPKNIIKHRISIPIGDEIDLEEIKIFLSAYLLEDNEIDDEPLSERLSRLLKI